MRHPFCVLMAAIAAFALSATAFAETSLVITYAPLGPEAPEGGNVDGVVASLDARGEFNAVADAASRNADSWLRVPKLGAGGQWLNVVCVGFGERHDWIALRMDADGKSVLQAERRIARADYLDAPRRDWIAPGPNQLDQNAVKELAADIALGWRADAKSDASRTISVTMKTWTGDDLTAVSLDDMVGDEGETGGAAQQAVGGQHLTGVHAMAMAGLSDAGWSPTFGTAASTITIELGRTVDGFAVRATLGDRTGTRRHIHPHNLFDAVYGIVQQICRWGDAVSDVAQLGSGARPLFIENGDMVLQQGGGVRAVDVMTGKVRWQIEAPPRGEVTVVPQFNPWDARSHWMLFRTDGKLSSISVGDGAATAVADALPDHDWSFESQAMRGTAMVSKGVLGWYRGYEATWTAELPDGVAAGPAKAGERIVAVSGDGVLHAWNQADGKPLWAKPGYDTAYGRITSLSKMVIVSGTDGNIRAVSPEDGSELWSVSLDDRLVASPILTPRGGLALVDKANRVTLVHGETGEVLSSWQAPRWLRGAALPSHASKQLYVWDIRGDVTVLDLEGLKPVRTISLGRPLTDAHVVGINVPLQWTSRDEFAGKGDVLYLTATDGTMFMVPTRIDK